MEDSLLGFWSRRAEKDWLKNEFGVVSSLNAGCSDLGEGSGFVTVEGGLCLRGGRLLLVAMWSSAWSEILPKLGAGVVSESWSSFWWQDRDDAEPK